MKRTFLATLCMLALPASAAGLPSPGARLPATGGVSQIEGAAGGGLTPWALIAGYGSRDQTGFTVFHTRADPTDFSLHASGVAVGIRDRVEFSYARQVLGLGRTVPGQSIGQDIFGVKVKVAGDAVFDQDRWMPQVAFGLQYKRNDDMAVPTALGARHAEGVDVYVAATKVWLGAAAGRNVLLNGTLRATKANQLGLLGFGGDRRDDYRLMPELSVGVFLTDNLVFGAEWRRKPDNLSVFREESFKDVYLAWFAGKRLSLTAAWVDLGQIADRTEQRAFYLSGQLAF
jgi:hypothetical protein